MKSIFNAFACNTVFANIMLLLILLAGTIAATAMIREVFPDVSTDSVIVSVAWPDAGAEEAEEAIAQKIEEALEGMEGVRETLTVSGENGVEAEIEVKRGYVTADVLDRVRSKIGAISTFPRDAEKPLIFEEMHRGEVMKLYLAGDMSEGRLKKWAQQIKDEIRLLPEASQIEILGTREAEIHIEISEARLREYGLSLEEVAAAVSNSNLNLSGGTIRTREEEIRIRTMGRKYTGADLSAVVVRAGPNGDIITLERVAEIRDGFNDDAIVARIDGHRAVILDIFKTRQEDALAISEAVVSFVQKKQRQLPDGVKIGILYDTTGDLRARIDLLVKNGIMGLGLVLLLLWMFLDFRLSFWAGMGIPVSIMGALVVLWAMGGTINMLSLFGLIMALGIIVDDAIVVGEAIFLHRQGGLDPPAAVWAGIREVGTPVAAATATTIVAFIPLACIGDVIGKFIAVLPMVVIPCLTISLVECLLLLPAHLNHQAAPRPEKAAGLHRRIDRVHLFFGRTLAWVTRCLYAPVLKRALVYRYVTLSAGICALFLTFGLVVGGIVKFEALPDSDGFVVTATLTYPQGTPLEKTRLALDRIEASLVECTRRMITQSGAPLLEKHFAIAGRTASEHPQSGPHVGAVTGILLASEDRGIPVKDILVRWETAVGAIAGAESLTFASLALGPPGEPIEVRLRGRDMSQIRTAAGQLTDRLRRVDGVSQVRSDQFSGKNELRVAMKPEARSLGLAVKDLAEQVRAGFHGIEAVRLQHGQDDIRVKVRYPEAERDRISILDQIRIRTPAGREIPLLSAADVAFSPGLADITRLDGLRCVTVKADVDTNKANAEEIIENLQHAFIPGLKARFPDLVIEFKGSEKHMQDAIGGLAIGFPLAVLGIFIIIAGMFKSYLQPCLVLFTIPFGIIGAILGHLAMGLDLSLMSIFGMAALTGVVVNDAIVLVERINENLAGKMDFFDAVTNGGTRRFRAIFLTTVSTVGGLAPLILETSQQARFLVPTAVSIAAGLLFATVLTLLLVPGMFVILNDARRVWHRINTGKWPARETVEPARGRCDDTRAHVRQRGGGMTSDKEKDPAGTLHDLAVEGL